MSEEGKDPGKDLTPTGEPDGKGIPQYVTDLRPIERQVGEHIIASLQHPGTVAVISAVMPGGETNQRIVSVPLNQDLFEQVQELVAEAQAARDEPDQEVPCIGFHCVLEGRERDRKEKEKKEGN
ncbi:MAG: hypothetical protein JSV91_11475 [Phycisphaerales bacterium]|nr:MAG: hypothetical protein JSV91_11475 [Phycisphaerales bacterium]